MRSRARSGPGADAARLWWRLAPGASFPKAAAPGVRRPRRVQPSATNERGGPPRVFRGGPPRGLLPPQTGALAQPFPSKRPAVSGQPSQRDGTTPVFGDGPPRLRKPKPATSAVPPNVQPPAINERVGPPRVFRGGPARGRLALRKPERRPRRPGPAVQPPATTERGGPSFGPPSGLLPPGPKGRGFFFSSAAAASAFRRDSQARGFPSPSAGPASFLPRVAASGFSQATVTIQPARRQRRDDHAGRGRDSPRRGARAEGPSLPPLPPRSLLSLNRESAAVSLSLRVAGYNGHRQVTDDATDGAGPPLPTFGHPLPQGGEGSKARRSRRADALLPRHLHAVPIVM